MTLDPARGVSSTGAGASAGDGGGVVAFARCEPGIVKLTLNRPESRNALSIEMMSALRSAIAEAGGDGAVRAIVLAANGPAFCAGHDLKELTARRTEPDGGRAFFSETMALCAALMQDIVRCPKPVIAAVHATATAAGCQLVATADLAVAAQSAQFCTPGVNIGLFCSTPMVALSRNVSRKRAMEMLLLGDMVSASDAAAWGLVNRVVAPQEVLGAALAMARQIASKSSATVKLGKAAFYEQSQMKLTEAYDYAARIMVENMMLADAEEGIGSFLAKRKPEWKGC